MADVVEELVDECASAGRPLRAMDLLRRFPGTSHHPSLSRRLLHLRYDAFHAVVDSDDADTTEADPAEPERPADLWADPTAPPEVAAADLTPGLIRGAIEERGSLLVRGLVPRDDAARLVDQIDTAFDAAFEARSGAGAEVDEGAPTWYEPFRPGRDHPISDDLDSLRWWLHDIGGFLAADSPRITNDYLQVLEKAGVAALIHEYFGERPALLMEKLTLRRVSPGARTPDWHQDGSFLGVDIELLNTWVSLSHCGWDAPGLELVPARIGRILETGTEGATEPWTVAPSLVDEARAGIPLARPVFEPGDVLIFDEKLLHRVHASSDMTDDRYAIETWFFRPSTYDQAKIPLMV